MEFASYLLYVALLLKGMWLIAVVKLLNAVNIVFFLNILASWFAEGVMLYLQEEKYGFVRCGLHAIVWLFG